MIIFESILTPYKPSSMAPFFEAPGAIATIGSSLKLNHHWDIQLA
jgi:hypothetical protein